MTIVESLKKVVKAYGGEDSNANTIVEGLRDIVTAMGGSTADGNTVAQVIEDIAAAVPGSGGGGSSDFSTAEVTIVNNYPNHSWLVYLCVTEEAEDEYPAWSIGNYAISDDTVFNAILYKGLAAGRIDETNQDTYKITAEGNATVVDEYSGTFEVTGDCTITITAD